MGKQDIKRLYKSEDDKKWDGVLGGIAEYMEIDSTVVRVIYAILTIATGVLPGLITYFVLSVIIPKKSKEKK